MFKKTQVAKAVSAQPITDEQAGSILFQPIADKQAESINGGGFQYQYNDYCNRTNKVMVKTGWA